MKTLDNKLSLRELRLLDLVMSGEAARICRVDRRTFYRRVELGEIKAVANVEGKAVFKREDVERLAKRIHAEIEARKKQ